MGEGINKFELSTPGEVFLEVEQFAEESERYLQPLLKDILFKGSQNGVERYGQACTIGDWRLELNDRDETGKYPPYITYEIQRPDNGYRHWGSISYQPGSVVSTRSLSFPSIWQIEQYPEGDDGNVRRLIFENNEVKWLLNFSKTNSRTGNKIFKFIISEETDGSLIESSEIAGHVSKGLPNFTRNELEVFMSDYKKLLAQTGN